MYEEGTEELHRCEMRLRCDRSCGYTGGAEEDDDILFADEDDDGEEEWCVEYAAAKDREEVGAMAGVESY